MNEAEGSNSTKKLILDVAKEGKLADLLIVLSENDGKILSTESQKYFCRLINDDHLMISDLEENSKVVQSDNADTSESEDNSAATPVTNDDTPQNYTSVLLTAVEKKNVEVTGYLITYCSHLIQQLPFDHQVRISTAAFETNQLNVLCDLLNFSDFPFPENFEAKEEKCAEHEGMCKILGERTELKSSIEKENFEFIDKFAEQNPNLKIVFILDNISAMNHALKSEKLKIYFYLKSLGFYAIEFDDHDEVLDNKKLKEAKLQAEIQRSKSINEARCDSLNSANLLCIRSFIHNKRISWEQDAAYRINIKQWYTDVFKVAPEVIEIAASCEGLKIIYDFESNYVDNIDLESSKSSGLTRRGSKWIFIGAKLSVIEGEESKKREQEIKGVIAHELCHYVMCLVYNNKFLPYYENANDMREKFEKVVQSIDKWSADDSEKPNDECNNIISLVFTAYDPKKFHLELIVRVVHILAEFDDNKEKSVYLQTKYKKLFGFWSIHILPELQNYNQRNKFVKKLNGFCGLLQKISRHKLELTNEKDLDPLIDSKLAIVTTNISTLLLINIQKYLQEKFGILKDLNFLFTKPKKLINQEIWNTFEEICKQVTKLSIFVDCTKEFPDCIGQIFLNKQLSYIFIVSSKQQCEKLEQIFKKKKKIENSQKLEINYNWSDLTKESQNLLLQTKINFQNNSEILLMDLLEQNFDPQELEENQNSSDILGMLVNKLQIDVNTQDESNINDEYLTLTFQQRFFYKKNYKGNKIMFQDQLLNEVKNQQYVLISDQAGNGKSWAMKNFTKILREKNPAKWVTYVDLKQFIDEFKAQKGEPEFSTFMVEKILKPKSKFEAEIFQKMYKNGKVFILFDGFDEIAPNYAEFVSKLAQNFEYNEGNQLWIATRDYFEVNLTEKLEIDVVYRLCKMNQKDGVNLIATNWMLMDLKDSKDIPNETLAKKENLLKFEIYKAKALLIIKKAAFSRSHFIALPQMFKMIADGFKDEENLDDLQKSKIYDKFIKSLYKRWSEQKGQIRNEASIASQQFEMKFYEFHQYHAILSLFPELAAILSLFPELAAILFPGYDGIEWKEQEIIACGIMTIKNRKKFFVHETFREYFVADFITKKLKKSKVFEKIIEIIIEILSDKKFEIIRMFLSDMINVDSNGENIKSEIQKPLESSYEIAPLASFCINTPKYLVDFTVVLIKNGNLKKIKEILYQNIMDIINNTKELKVFSKFLDFVMDLLKVDDLKEFIIEKEIVQKILKSNIKVEFFEEFMGKIEEKVDRNFVRQILTNCSTSRYRNHDNIFCLFSKLSCNIYCSQVDKFLKTMEKFFTDTEMFVLISKCNDKRQNILQVCVEKGNKENLENLWTEIEIYFERKRFIELVKQCDADKRNILHSISSSLYSYYNGETLLKTFEDREELKDFILQKDDHGRNFIHELVNKNRNPDIIKWTFDVLKNKFNDAQFQEIIQSKGFYEMNFIQTAAYGSKIIEVHKFLWKFFRDFCGTDEMFLEMIKAVDGYGQNILQLAAMGSSSKVFEFLIQELEKIASQDEIREMLRKLNTFHQNFLQSAADKNKSLELHRTLWKITKKYFEKGEILEFIEHASKNRMNLFFIAVEGNTKEIVELTWNEIKIFLTHDQQVEYLERKQGKERYNRHRMLFR